MSWHREAAGCRASFVRFAIGSGLGWVSFAGVFDIDLTVESCRGNKPAAQQSGNPGAGPAFGTLEMMNIIGFGEIHRNIAFGILLAGALIP